MQTSLNLNLKVALFINFSKGNMSRFMCVCVCFLRFLKMVRILKIHHVVTNINAFFGVVDTQFCFSVKNKVSQLGPNNSGNGIFFFFKTAALCCSATHGLYKIAHADLYICRLCAGLRFWP